MSNVSYGTQGYVFPPGYFGNDPATARANTFFQAGVTGATALAAAPSGIGQIQWTVPQLQSSGLYQTTGVGTGAAWIQVSNAGLYEVDYTLGITGGASGLVVDTWWAVNGTGVTASGVYGGSAIDASASHITQASGVNSQPNQRFLLSLGTGSVLIAYTSLVSGQPGPALMQTGTHVGIRQIA